MRKGIIKFYLLLCGVLFLPFCVHAETTNVSIEIQPPMVGRSFQEMVWNSYSSEYSLSLDLYNNTDKVVVLGNTSIKKNKDYTLSVRIDTYENEVLPDDLIVSLSGFDKTDFYVDKTEAIKTNTSYEFKIHYSTKVDKHLLYSVLNFDSFGKPVVGEKVIYKVINQGDSNKKYYTVNQAWYEKGSDVKLTENDVFEANKQYEYHLEILPKEGYTFSEYIPIEDYIFYQSGYFRYLDEDPITISKTRIDAVYNYDTTQLENTIYGPIHLEAPNFEVGKSVPSFVSHDDRYTITANWYYYDSNYSNTITMQEGDIFEVGKSYYCNLQITPKEGYQVENNLEIILDNVSSDPNFYFHSNGWNSAYLSIGFYNYTYQINDLYSVNSNEAKPRVGKKPEELRVYSYIDGDTKYDITSQKWYVGSSEMGSNDVFAKNRSYKLVVTYQAKGDYYFTENCKNNVGYFPSDFLQESNVISFSDKEITVEYLFYIEYKDNYIYDALDLNIKAPVIGNNVQFASILSTDYSIVNQSWYNYTDHVKMTLSDKFEKDKIYGYFIELKPSGGKAFSGEFSITSSQFENSPYLDKNYRLRKLLGGYGSTSGGETITYGEEFVTTDVLSDENYVIGYVEIDSHIVMPRTGSHISYAQHNSEDFYVTLLKEHGLTVEKGWYEEGSDILLTENDIFMPNKIYEYHLRYSSIGDKIILPGLLTAYEDNYRNYYNSPYYKGFSRIDKDGYTELILTYEMGKTNYDQDESIIKTIDLGEVVEPKIGEKITLAELNESEKYSVSEGWYLANDYPGTLIDLNDNPVFEESGRYELRFVITPKDQYKFSDEVNIMINTANNTGFYYNYDKKKNVYTVTVYYSNMVNPIYEDPNQGFFSFKKNEYSNGLIEYNIPSDLDTLVLQVEKKSGEFDINFSYLGLDYNEPNIEEIDYDIDGDIVTLSNISKVFENNNLQRVSIGVSVDGNDQYGSYYINYFLLSDNQTSMTVALPTITDYEGKADGEGHSISVEGGIGGTIVYSLDGKTWQEEVPKVSKAGVTKVYVKINPDDGYVGLLPIYGYVKLYGESTAYEVRFHSNDENDQLKRQSVISDEESTLDKNTFLREGYEFDKWTTNPDGTGDSYEDGASIDISNDLDLYAQWKMKNVSLSVEPEFIDYGKISADFENAITKKVVIKNTSEIDVSLNINNPINDGPFASQNFENGKVLKPNEEYQVTLFLNPNGTNHNKPGSYQGVYRIIGTDINHADNKFTLEIPAKVVIEAVEPVDPPEPPEPPVPSELSVSYTTHVQTYGWQDYVSNGTMAGTEGQAKRLEGIKIKLENAPYEGDILYRTHIQSIGWESEFKKNNDMSGTEGRALRLEAIEIKLDGEMAEHYDVYYRVHAQKFGWLGWARNGESAGTAAFAYRLEGIEIQLVEKGQEFSEYGKRKPFEEKLVQYTTHVQSYGWQEYTYDGNMAGTSGEAKRLEAIKIFLANQKYSGDIIYRTHIQSYGWENSWKRNNEMSGTSGEAKRLEAIQIRLTGEMKDHYDVYYRVHAQSFGWLAWAKNGESAGTAGYAKRLEGIEIVLVEKGGTPPIRDNQNDTRSYIENS